MAAISLVSGGVVGFAAFFIALAFMNQSVASAFGVYFATGMTVFLAIVLTRVAAEITHWHFRRSAAMQTLDTLHRQRN